MIHPVVLSIDLALRFAGYLRSEVEAAGLSMRDLIALAVEEARDLGAQVILTVSEALAARGISEWTARQLGHRTLGTLARTLAAEVGALAATVCPPSRRRAAVDAAGLASGRSRPRDRTLSRPLVEAERVGAARAGLR